MSIELSFQKSSKMLTFLQRMKLSNNNSFHVSQKSKGMNSGNLVS